MLRGVFGDGHSRRKSRLQDLHLKGILRDISRELRYRLRGSSHNASYVNNSS